jgi:aromatic amino acid aminotransferase I / 2-aminoadipate transaminase
MPVAPHFSESDTAANGQTFTAHKYDVQENKSDFDLAISLNYGQSMGPPQLVRFITEHTEIVHNPPYSDWDICLTAGSTSALEIALRMFCSRGDYLMTEEYSFSSAIETCRPMGLHLLGIRMDEHGMLPSDLDHVLSTWNPSERNGASKPFIIYTVPTGQNPTSSTQTLSRRREIYSIAEKHDLYILEDEPYYFLQMEDYAPGTIHTIPKPFRPTSTATFLSNLIPSFLSIDTSGRVLRLDSFSKIIAPGSRTGWVTGSSQIIERFIRHNEVSLQNPSGFAEVILYKLLEENWSHKGFLEWLMFIRAEYTRRRDVICAACERFLPQEVASWVAPKAGMFHWIEIDIAKHPRYHAGLAQEEVVQIEEKVFLRGVEKGVLMARGSWFRAEKGTDEKLFLRMTFAAASEERIEEAVRRAGEALRDEFGLPVGENGVNGHGNGHQK